MVKNEPKTTKIPNIYAQKEKNNQKGRNIDDFLKFLGGRG